MNPTKVNSPFVKIKNCCDLLARSDMYNLPRVIAISLIIFRVVRPTETGAKAKIGEFDVAVAVDQNVIRFDVAVDEAPLVDALHGTNQFRYVKPVNISIRMLYHLEPSY